MIRLVENLPKCLNLKRRWNAFGMLFTLLKLVWNLIVIEYIFTNLQMAKRTKKISHLVTLVGA